MLESARELFAVKGYKTTMDDIADTASVGVATVYNYFRSKEGIFAELVRKDSEEIRMKGETVLESPPQDALDAVRKLMEIHSEIFELMFIGMMTEFITQSRSNGPLHEAAEWILVWERDQLSRLLARFADSGQLRDGLDCDLAARVISDLFVRRAQHHYAGFPGGPSGIDELCEAIAFVIGDGSTS